MYIVYLTNGTNPVCYQTKVIGFSEHRLKAEAIAEVSEKLGIPEHRLIAKGRSEIRSKQLCCTWEEQVFEAKVQMAERIEFGS